MPADPANLSNPEPATMPDMSDAGLPPQAPDVVDPAEVVDNIRAALAAALTARGSGALEPALVHAAEADRLAVALGDPEARWETLSELIAITQKAMNIEAVIALTRIAVSVARRIPDRSREALAWAAHGAALRAHDEDVQAARALREAFALGLPRTHDARRELALARVKIGEVGRDLDDELAGLTRESEAADGGEATVIRAAHVEYLLTTGQIVRAKSVADKLALGTRPIAFLRAHVALAAQDADAARAFLAPHLAAGAEPWPNGWLLEGVACDALGQVVEAEHALTRALDTEDPSLRATGLLRRAGVRLRRFEGEAARVDLDEAFARSETLTPEQQASGWVLRAMLALQDGQRLEAERAFGLALAATRKQGRHDATYQVALVGALGGVLPMPMPEGPLVDRRLALLGTIIAARDAGRTGQFAHARALLDAARVADRISAAGLTALIDQVAGDLVMAETPPSERA